MYSGGVFMRALVFILLTSIFLLLSACIPSHVYYRAKCTLIKNCQFLRCVEQCEQHLAACTKVCHNNCRRCHHCVQKAAAKNYSRYVNRQYVQGQMLALNLNSFRDPLQCRKTTCDCQADYQVCVQACGGLIHKSLQAAPICC